jgi:hypothetical protein
METSDWDFALYYRSRFDPDELRPLASLARCSMSAPGAAVS